MPTHMNLSNRSARTRIAGVALSVALFAGLVVGCTDITNLDQENPGTLSASDVYVPGNAPLIVNGAIADFECAFARYVVGSGLFADELINAIASVDNYNYERRALATNAGYGSNGCGAAQNPGVYTTLSTARGVADTALAHLEGWTDAEVPTRQKFMGQMAAYGGYSLLLLGEGMCSAAINLGPELQPTQLFQEAKSRFDKAITAATAANDALTLNLAYLGRARALLATNDVAGAGADAARIPAAYVLNMSTNDANARRQNFVYVHTTQSSYSSIDPSFRDVQLNGSPDPRVLVTNTTKAGTAPGTVVWTANKYPSFVAPIAIAKYAEAQLIVAEAKAAANDLAGAQTAINNARNSGRTGMPQYDATGQTKDEVKAQIIEERRRELFLEGHRLGDMRRYNVPMSPAAGSPYAAGGGVYGTQTCFPLPDVERINNPNIGAP